uniref:Nephrocystin 3-like N-terminal domain-containing protein n=1 Tax=Bionectria ochroleuca TaxID=29856 RepID=A0A0B7JWK8_BIOOC
MGWISAITSSAYPAGATIIVLLLGLLLLALPRWIRFAIPSPSTASAAPMCYRIQQIPATVTETELLRQLVESIPGFDGLNSASLRLKIARSLGQSRTATFISAKAPRNLGYHVDKNFYGITLLFEGENAMVDIIAVHGLGSHAIGGFQSKETQAVWLRDFLPKDFPNSRILVYGYGSAVTDKDSKISIEGLARSFLDSYKAFRQTTETTQRPIIFIGHSLGGLLIKEALILANQNDKDRENSDFFKSASGLMFFGVPNMGINLGKLREITRDQLNNQLIMDLQLDSESEPTPYMKTLLGRFRSCHEKQDPPMRIISYYEEKMTDTLMVDKSGKISRGGHKCFMVTEESACQIGFMNNTHDRLPLPSNHSNLVKFLNEADDSYIRVRNKLRRLIEEGPDVVSKRFVPPTKLSSEEKRHWADLNVPDYRAFYKSGKLAKPTEGTLQWLVQEAAAEKKPFPYQYDKYERDIHCLRTKDFEAWQKSPMPCALLVLGQPGQGKSVLSNFIVSHLQQQHSVHQKSSVKVIYFFCNIKDNNSRTASSVLRALIVQLSEDQRLFQTLPNRFQDPKEYRSFHSAGFYDLWSTFQDLVSLSPYDWIHCIIDGLDVYPDPEMRSLVQKLHDMVQGKSAYRLKLFFTSRPTGPVDMFTAELRRNLRPPQKDIKIFIESQVESLPKRFKNFKREIVDSLMKFAGGTFLWIHIVLGEVQKLRYPTSLSVQETIEKTPLALNELYTTLIQTAFKDDHDKAILAWVAYAKKPLTLEELEMAVAAMVTNANSLSECNKQKASLDSDSIHEKLGALIDIIDNHLYLIHQSLLDFLKGQQEIWEKGGLTLKFQRHPSVELGWVCLKYLSFSDLTFIDKSEPHFPNVLLFPHYASNHWYEHIQSAEDLTGCAEKLKYALKGQNKLFWLKRNYRWEQRASRSLFPLRKSIFSISLVLDIGWLARILIDNSIPEISEILKERDLMIAAGGAPKVVQELLRDKDAFPKDSMGVGKATPKSKNLIKILLEHRSDEIKITENVLREAAMNYINGKMVLELLPEERGGEVRITENVLISAAMNRHHAKEILKLMLEERGEEVQITKNVVLTAVLHLKQAKEILELFLDMRGDEVQITNGVVNRALINTRNGKELIELLLEKRGHEVRITESLIETEIRFQEGKVLELLLEKGGDEIQITEKVILAAAKNNSRGRRILELLLEKRGNKIQITEKVVTAVKEFESGRKWLEQQGIVC